MQHFLRSIGWVTAAVALLAVSVIIICDVHQREYSAPETITPAHATPTENRSSALTEYPIDLNAATFENLVLIDAISPKIAESIIEYRNINGDFTSVDQLIEVYGIGTATLEKIMPYFYVSAPDVTTVTTGFSSECTTITTVATTVISVFSQKIELNTGTLEDFLTIPIITADQAHAIVELRDKIHYFSHYYELLYAEGFDEQLVAQMYDYVYVEGRGE